MSQRIRPLAATAGFLPLRDRQRLGSDRMLFPDAATLRRARRPRRLRWRRYLVLVATAYCAWLGHGEWVSYHRLHVAAAGLNRQVAALEAEQASLKGAIAYAQTDAYIAAAAGQKFGLVAPGEVPLAPMPVAASPTPGTAASTPIQG